MLDTFTYRTRGVCSREINISINEGRLEKVSFKSGCNGNLKGVCRLVEGMTVQDVIAKLKGIDCDGKGTSCPDQLARALQEYIQK